MKGAQYCRYCSFCIEGDCYYCTDHEEVLSEKKIRQVNHCADFALSPTGDIITGRQYKPRTGKPITDKFDPNEVWKEMMEREVDE